MLITPSQLSKFWDVSPRTILHVGAHHAEELEAYEACGWGTEQVIWVDALPSAVEATRRRVAGRPNHLVLEAVAWSTSGEQVTFHEASNGQSSSVLDFGTHSTHYPDIHFTKEVTLTTSALGPLLDEVRARQIDFINLDIQGAELEALKGLGARVQEARAIYSEVNVENVYEHCALVADMDDWLAGVGFSRIDTQMTASGWGDALWLRSDETPPLPRLRAFGRKALTHVSRVRGALGLP